MFRRRLGVSRPCSSSSNLLSFSSSSTAACSVRFTASFSSSSIDPAKISKSHVWGLWNEGNLFSLSVAELTKFLEQHQQGSGSGSSEGDVVGGEEQEQQQQQQPKLKKTALVRRVEDLMSRENPATFGNSAVVPETVSSVAREHAIDAGLVNEADAARAAAQRAASSQLPSGSAVVGGSMFRHNLHHSFDEGDHYCDWQVAGAGAGGSAADWAAGSSVLDPTTGLIRLGRMRAAMVAAAENDFIAFDAPGEIKSWIELDHDSEVHLASKGYQLLHQTSTADVGLVQLRGVENLPGCAELVKNNQLRKGQESSSPSSGANNNNDVDEDEDADEDDDDDEEPPSFFTAVCATNNKLPTERGRISTGASADDFNRVRFRRAFHWSVSSAWANNREAEINIGAGRIILKSDAAKNDVNVVPIWTAQQHLKDAHPFMYLALAHDSARPVMEHFAVEQLGMAAENFRPADPEAEQGEVSYKVAVRGNGTKVKGWVDAQANARFETTHVNRPWFRYLMTHYIREEMPDLRFLMRARNLLASKDAEPFMQAPMIKAAAVAAGSSSPLGFTVEPALNPELGDVQYICHRVIRRWSTRMNRRGSPRISLVETKRTPLLCVRADDLQERLEYEIIATVPRPEDGTDIGEMADELWDKGQMLARALRESSDEFNSYPLMKVAIFV